MEPVAEKADRLKALLSVIRGRYVLTRYEKVIGLREHYALVLWKEKKKRPSAMCCAVNVCKEIAFTGSKQTETSRFILDTCMCL